ncbi:MAG: RagB/SusD family nutrient uptake outer membrane protein [Marinifilum sp.]|nr:RagB/SusD family nutrient uptake outer membrane protein [Marinifilum sp.]
MRYLNLVYIGLVFLMASCDDYVNITPKGNAIAEDLDDVNAMLEYAQLLSTSRGFENDAPTLLNDNIHIKDAELLDFETVYGGMNKTKAYIYRMEDVFYPSSENDGGWMPYNVISYCNYLLEIIPGMEGDDNVKNQYMGETLVHRAFAYFRLVNYYGYHYGTPQASQEESGVPMVFNYGDVTESIKRASTNDVYEMIVTDLEKAIGWLNNGRPFVDRVHKDAARALLSRVYLHMAKYEEALKYADDILKSYGSDDLLNYEGLIGQIPPNNLNNPEVILYKSNSLRLYTGEYPYYGVARYSDDLVAAFDKPEKDLRLISYKANDGEYIVNGSAPYGYESALAPTVPEIMLIKAECLAHTPNFQDGIDVINKLREKRFKAADVATDAHLLTASSQEDALAKVINERRLEFNIHGMRFFDIKRLNANENAGIDLVRKFNLDENNVPEITKTWKANGVNWCLPIGEAILETSGGALKNFPRE